MYDRKILMKDLVSEVASIECFHNGERITEDGLMMVRHDYLAMGVRTLAFPRFILSAVFNASFLILMQAGASLFYI